MDKRFWIIVGILALVGFGFMFVTTTTGSVITGSVIAPMEVESESFRISDFGNEVNTMEVEDGEGRSR